MNELTIFERDGKVLVNSRDVATKTGKRHADILRDIDNLLKNNADADLRWLIEAPYTDEQGKERRSVDMTKDGFTLLSMGWTGSKWVNAKIQWIKQFNLMEAELKRLTQRGTAPVELNREERLRIGFIALQEINEEQAKKIENIEPGHNAWQLLSKSAGSLCLSDAAKELNLKPKEFIRQLNKMKWIFLREGSGHWVGYQNRINNGDLDHVPFEYMTKDGPRCGMQVKVTSQGMAKLAKLFSNKKPPNGSLPNDAPVLPL